MIEEEAEFDLDAEEPIDFSDWELASKAEVIEKFKNPEATEAVKVPIDYEKKKYITLHIRQMPINEQLQLMEDFMTFDTKGEAKFKWRQYYAQIFVRMVKKAEPSLTWKEVRFYNKHFMPILMNYLPNPMEDLQEPTGLSIQDRKNL